MNRVNKKRKRKRAEEGKVYGPYHRWMRSQVCVLAGRGFHFCTGRRVGHHVVSVGAGGQDYANEVSACTTAHALIHGLGHDTFEQRYNINLRAEAMRYAKLWDEREAA